MFGREFENHNFPSLTKNYLRCITLDQTFSDNFVFVGLNLKYIPCSLMHNESRHPLNQVVPPCKLAKIRHVMMAFINSEILPKDCFLDDDNLHEHVGSYIFFHDRLIERWMCDIDIDVVSEAFSMRGADSSIYARECKKFRKKNIFLIVRRVTRLYVYDTQTFVYVYDGDYLNVKFRKELIKTSESDKDRVLLIMTYRQCQRNSICIYRINRLFSILDALHDPKHKFSYLSTIGGVVLETDRLKEFN